MCETECVFVHIWAQVPTEALNTVELELHLATGHHVDAENCLGSLQKQSGLLTAELSF